MSSTTQIATAGLLGFTLLVAHNVADHWTQTKAEAQNKGLPGWQGRQACLAHVLSYTATAVAFTAAIWFIFDLQISILGFYIGQAISSVSHYWADRRFTLEKLAGWVGHRDFYRLGQPRASRDDNPSLGTGAYVLDQSWHWFWIFISTIVMVVIP